MLIEHGANLSIDNYNGETPLLMACGNENENIVKLLVEPGADINKDYVNMRVKDYLNNLYNMEQS